MIAQCSRRVPYGANIVDDFDLHLPISNRYEEVGRECVGANLDGVPEAKATSLIFCKMLPLVDGLQACFRLPRAP
ncbi:MAG: hypothetical protein FWD73_14390 [Polyangiaceae bacterium]|nr:hypothetical protein [Polyangiaceae bacterium]